ncbi:branched-chain amino acid ABC transporter permease [Nocardia alni]|uniref:branched-chain amino acid ABC transporter permease n=1 Tax=Nocardia alni TaxID=2815723 RepID=UPI001C223C72|nr:branched-chain amino acid ABC transporter permease [Nocardia alni]
MIATLAVGLALGAMYALVATGYTIVYRATGVINFASGTYVVVGGLGSYWLSEQEHWPYGLAVVGGTVLAGVWSSVLWFVIIVPLWRRRSPGYIVLLSTVMVAALSAPLIEKLVTPDAQTLPAWVPGWQVRVGQSRISGQYVLIMAVSIAVVVAVTLLLRYSTTGRRLRACAANRETSRLLGIHPEGVGAVAMAVTGLLGGLAGAMAIAAQAIQPDVGLSLSVFAFVAAVFGGLESAAGAFAGGLVLGVAQTLVDRYYTASYDELIVFGLLTAVLLLRPQGLLVRSRPR